MALGGWFITIAGLHITTSVGGRMTFALVGIAVSLIGVLGVLPVAFGKNMAGKSASTKLVVAKSTVEETL